MMVPHGQTSSSFLPRPVAYQFDPETSKYIVFNDDGSRSMYTQDQLIQLQTIHNTGYGQLLNRYPGMYPGQLFHAGLSSQLRLDAGNPLRMTETSCGPNNQQQQDENIRINTTSQVPSMSLHPRTTRSPQPQINKPTSSLVKAKTSMSSLNNNNYTMKTSLPMPSLGRGPVHVANIRSSSNSNNSIKNAKGNEPSLGCKAVQDHNLSPHAALPSRATHVSSSDSTHGNAHTLHLNMLRGLSPSTAIPLIKSEPFSAIQPSMFEQGHSSIVPKRRGSPLSGRPGKRLTAVLPSHKQPQSSPAMASIHHLSLPTSGGNNATNNSNHTPSTSLSASSSSPASLNDPRSRRPLSQSPTTKTIIYQLMRGEYLKKSKTSGRQDAYHSGRVPTPTFASLERALGTKNNINAARISVLRSRHLMAETLKPVADLLGCEPAMYAINSITTACPLCTHAIALNKLGSHENWCKHLERHHEIGKQIAARFRALDKNADVVPPIDRELAMQQEWAAVVAREDMAPLDEDPRVTEKGVVPLTIRINWQALMLNQMLLEGAILPTSILTQEVAVMGSFYFGLVNQRSPEKFGQYPQLQQFQRLLHETSSAAYDIYSGVGIKENQLGANHTRGQPIVATQHIIQQYNHYGLSHKSLQRNRRMSPSNRTSASSSPTKDLTNITRSNGPTKPQMNSSAPDPPPVVTNAHQLRPQSPAPLHAFQQQPIRNPTVDAHNASWRSLEALPSTPRIEPGATATNSPAGGITVPPQLSSSTEPEQQQPGEVVPPVVPASSSQSPAAPGARAPDGGAAAAMLIGLKRNNSGS